MRVNFIEPALKEGHYCWLIDLGGRLVGVHAQTGWCVRIDKRILALDAESNFVPLVPLLDAPEADFSAFLKKSAEATPALARQILAFPKKTLLKHVFNTSYSGYWPERAINWLAADEMLWPQFQKDLEAFSVNKVMPQTARQRARRMLRAIACYRDDLFPRPSLSQPVPLYG